MDLPLMTPQQSPVLGASHVMPCLPGAFDLNPPDLARRPSAPLPPNPSSSEIDSVGATSPTRRRPKRVQVKNACTNCQKACKKCSDQRPCERCIKVRPGSGHGFCQREEAHPVAMRPFKFALKDCVDSVRKPRRRAAQTWVFC